MINTNVIVYGFGIIFVLILIMAIYIIYKTFTAPIKECSATVIGKRRARNSNGNTSYKVMFQIDNEQIECIARREIFENIQEKQTGYLKYQDGIFKILIDFSKN